jgi:membrane protease subunit HflK
MARPSQSKNESGPWGKDPGQGPDTNNPWGNRSRKSKSPGEGPDLESLIRQGQERLKKMFPLGEGKGSGSFLIIILGVALFLWLSTGFYLVSEGEVGVEQRFGKYTVTTQPGLRYHLPAPIEKATVIRVAQINQIVSGIQVKSDKALMGEESDNLMLTGDENILSLIFSVLWFIKDPVNYLFTDPAPQQTVKLAAESAVREVIAQTKIADALTKGKDKIVSDSQKLLQKMLDEYGVGIEIQKVNLLEVNPPRKVIDAYRDVQRARADYESKINEARAYQNSIIPEARGQAQQIIQNAEAYRQSVVADAQGQTERFLALLKEYQAAPEVTQKRIYIDSMMRILQGVNKVVVEGSTQGILPYLSLPPLQKLNKEPEVNKP